MVNSIAYPTIFQTELDKAYAANAVTGWMGRNARLIKYNGGREVKIPKMTLQGLADYSKSGGYTEGDVTLEYETRSMSRDRGRGFTLDAMDVNESNCRTSREVRGLKYERGGNLAPFPGDLPHARFRFYNS